jgi:two-component system cell cycle response regulator DivK
MRNAQASSPALVKLPPFWYVPGSCLPHDMKRILLIEDSLENAILVERILEASGYQLLHAANGESGIQVAIEETPDMVLIDIGLPDIDGHTVLTLLRQVSELEGVPLVAITAWPADIAQEMTASSSNRLASAPFPSRSPNFSYPKRSLNESGQNPDMDGQ